MIVSLLSCAPSDAHLTSYLPACAAFPPDAIANPDGQYDPLLQPALLRHEVVSSQASLNTIASARFAAARILAGHDDRVLVVVGPCSIHSPEQAIEYANLLKSKMPDWGNLLIVMRAYLYVPPCPFLAPQFTHRTLLAR